MKIHLKIPGGGELYYEKPPRPPMSKERFDDIMGLVFSLGALAFVLLLVLSPMIAAAIYL